MTPVHDLVRSAAILLRKPSSWVALGLILVVAVIWTASAVRTSQPKTLDQRTMDVARQLQCPVCHGESVADAPSPLAQEMRSLIREELSQGMSEQQVIAYFHTRYGDQILESPPVTGFTGLIWLGPVLILALSAFILLSLMREWQWQRSSALAPLTAFDSDADSGPDPEDVLSSARVRREPPGELSREDRQRYLELLRREMAAEEGYEEGSAP
jgi:cytochrome c-type biogenesis protein CcmH